MTETTTTADHPVIDGTVENIPPLRQEVATQLYGGDPFLAMIERAAYRPDFNPLAMKFLLEERQKIIDDQRRMALNTAFAKAQGQFVPATKNRAIVVDPKDGKKGQNTPYADLMALWSSVQKPLSENGLSVWQELIAAPGTPITVITHLEHSGGWRRKAEITFPHDPSGSKNSVQGEASSVTYGRRLTLAAVLMLTAKDDPSDDNGVAAGDAVVRISEAVTLISEEQLTAVEEKLKAAGVPATAICINLKIQHLSDMPADQLDRVMKRLDATIKMKQEEAAKRASQEPTL